MYFKRRVSFYIFTNGLKKYLWEFLLALAYTINIENKQKTCKKYLLTTNKNVSFD